MSERRGGKTSLAGRCASAPPRGSQEDSGHGHEIWRLLVRLPRPRILPPRDTESQVSRLSGLRCTCAQSSAITGPHPPVCAVPLAQSSAAAAVWRHNAQAPAPGELSDAEGWGALLRTLPEADGGAGTRSAQFGGSNTRAPPPPSRHLSGRPTGHAHDHARYDSSSSSHGARTTRSVRLVLLRVVLGGRPLRRQRRGLLLRPQAGPAREQ